MKPCRDTSSEIQVSCEIHWPPRLSCDATACCVSCFPSKPIRGLTGRSDGICSREVLDLLRPVRVRGRYNPTPRSLRKPPRWFDSDSVVDISTLWEFVLESKACYFTRLDGSVSGQALPLVGVRRRFEVNLIAHSKALELLPTYPFGYTLLNGSPDGFPDGGL